MLFFTSLHDYKFNITGAPKFVTALVVVDSVPPVDIQTVQQHTLQDRRQEDGETIARLGKQPRLTSPSPEPKVPVQYNTYA